MRGSLWLALIVLFHVIIGCENLDKDAISTENLWGEAGATAYPQAAKKMSKSSPPGESLDDFDRESLRPIFDDLVDRVLIHWDAEPLDELMGAEFGVKFGDGDTVGQTFGLNIYIRGPKSSWSDRDRLQILIHEITHSFQFERLGSDMKMFGYEYFREYYQAGQSYELNPLEIEAMEVADREIENAMVRFLQLKT